MVSFALLTAAAESQAAARVFVSVDGSDMNTCSNVATPCRTFDASVAQVDPGGEVIVLASGSYGGVIIAKSVKINAPAGVVAFTAATIQVNGPGTTVALRGLTLKALTPGTGTGSSSRPAPGCRSRTACSTDGTSGSRLPARATSPWSTRSSGTQAPASSLRRSTSTTPTQWP
jgi:hypothetical protein